jgi:hypothetical protein
MTPEMVLEFIKTNHIEYADLRFLDFPGLWQHLTVPAREVTLDSFKDGFGFDGSSIRGWQAINESDMLIVPVAETMILDPFFQHPTISMICDVKNPLTRSEYSRDPRWWRANGRYMKNTGIADTAYFGRVGVLHFDKHYDQHEFRKNGSIRARGVRAGATSGQSATMLRKRYFPPPADHANLPARCGRAGAMGNSLEHAPSRVSRGPAEIDMLYTACRWHKVMTKVI